MKTSELGYINLPKGTKIFVYGKKKANKTMGRDDSPFSHLISIKKLTEVSTRNFNDWVLKELRISYELELRLYEICFPDGSIEFYRLYDEKVF
jgi:hypothetical protein